MLRWNVLLALAGCSSMTAWNVEETGLDPNPGRAPDTDPRPDTDRPAVDTGPDDTGTPSPDTGEPDPDPWGDTLDCSVGPGNGLDCYDLPSAFLSVVQKAVNRVISDHPDWFDRSGPGVLVLETESYMNAVVARVSAEPLCAIRDPNAGDEIAVKFNNAGAENFDILTWDGYARSGAGIYNGRCIPAWF